MADEQFDDTSAAVRSYLNPVERDPAQAARVSMSTAVDTNPEFEAELRRASTRTGVPIDSARAFPDEVKKQATLDAFDFDRLAVEFPSTAKFLSNTDNAKIAHDDTDNLSMVEKTLGMVKNTGKAAYAGFPGASAGILGVARAGVETFLQPITGMLAGTVLPEDIGGKIAGKLGQWQREQDAISKGAMPKTEGVVESGFYSGVRSLSQNLTMLPLAFLPGGQSAALTGMVAPAGGESYGKARDKGVPVLGALGYGASDALIEYATEMLPMSRLIGDVKAGTPFFKTLMHNAALEVPGEQLATVMQDMNEWAVLNPEKPFKDYLAERPSAAAQTLIATLVGTGGQVSIVKGIQGAADRATGRVRDAQRAEQDAQALTALNDLAAASKLRQRDPDGFQQFVAQAMEGGPVQNLYINANTLAQSGVDVEALAQASPAVAEQLQEALATGGDIRIPVDEFATHIAGTEYAQNLLQHLKTEPAGMTQAEAQNYMQNQAAELQAEVEKTLATKQGDDTFKASRDAVTAQVADQLKTAGRFTDDVNGAYASMIGNFYAVQAAKLGITPEEMAVRYPLRVQAERLVGAKTLDQIVYHGSPNAKVINNLRPSTGGELGPGFYFTKDEEVANGYTFRSYEGTSANAGVLKIDIGDMPLKDITKQQWVQDRAEFFKSEQAANGGEWSADVANRAEQKLIEKYRSEGYAGLYVEDEKQGVVFPDAMGDVTHTLNQTDLPGNIEVDGVTRPRNNSEGKPIAYTTASLEAFWRWFGDSKVVDDQGRPLVVYHGTRREFDVFEPMQPRGANGNPAGVYFTQDKQEAEEYAQDVDGATDEKSRVIAAYLSIKNDADGLIRDRAYGGTPEYVVLTPTQIKSVDNIGTWNPNDPRIMYQDGAADTGPFGPVFDQFKDDLAGAVAHLKEVQTGEAIGALSHPEIGEIDLVWGKEGTSKSDGYGLAKLLKWHPEVVDDLQNILSGMQVVSKNDNRAQLESPDHKAAIRLKWDGEAKKWLLTAFEKGKKGGTNTTTDTVDANGKGDTARSSTALDTSIDEDIQKFYQNARGSISLGNDITQTPSVITLLQKADLSTFLHESGHFFLEVLNDMASRQEAPDQVKQDMDAVLKWFGVADLATWNGYDIEQKRPYHEQFARGFEAYLFEGKSPSVEMNGLFQRFRAWMLNVYQSLKSLNVQLSDEVRTVFDRMLASSEAIADAEAVRGYGGLFETKPDFMTDADWLAYQALGGDATQEAVHTLESRSLRDMQWLTNAKSKLLGKMQRDASEKRKAVRREVETEVMAEPINQARTFLKRGELTTGDGEKVQAQAGHKLDITALKEMYPESALNSPDWETLGYGGFGMLGKEGLHPDLVGEMFGFTSGDQLVRELLTAEDPRAKIAGLTDQRMLEKHGDLTDTSSIERAADQALHNDARLRFVASEVNALSKAIGARPVLARAAKAFAEATIARLKVRELRPSQYASAAARAAKAADAAFKKGEIQQAAVEKRNQLVNSYADRAAHAARDEIDKAVDYFNKFSREGTRTSLDTDYLDQIDALLARFDLRKGQSLKAVDKRKSLAEWAESQREMGVDPDVPAELLNEALRKSFKDMTVEEVRGLRDTVKQIEHLARLKHKLLTAKDQREFEAIRDEIAQSITDNAGSRTADTRTPTTNMGRRVQGLKRFWAAHIKAATWARVFDGGKDGGPVWEYFIRSANEAGDRETTMRADATRALSDILAPVFKLGKMGGKGQFFPSINRSLNREARITIALNVGNESNLQRLLGGEGWTEAQLQPVLDSLTLPEWQAVQSIWDHFESYRPLIGAKERRVYGKEPAWLDPMPLTVTRDGQTIELRGGYYPVKYDPAASQRAEEHADAEGAKRQLQGAYTSATTRRSFTKARADEVVGRPLLYSLAGLYSGVNDVIHDLSWHEWLIDANRLLRSSRIDDAIRSHYGPEAKAQLKSWVNDVAEGEKGATNDGEVALGKLRQNVSVAGLGYNVVSAAMQGLGLTQSIVRVGATYIARGVVQYLASPIASTRSVNERSDFMANRARTRYRELNELRNRVQGDQGDFIKTHAYVLMMRCQQMVDVPTWLGAYEKATGAGEAEDRAIALADQAVIDAQGGGQTKDLASIERGGPALKLFTVFYSFMNTALNLGVAQTMTSKSRAKLAVDYLMLYTVPAVLGMVLKDALTPGDSGDDDDDLGKLALKLAAAQISYLMGLIVIGREFAEAGKALMPTGDKHRDYSGPAGVRMIADAYSFSKQASQGEFDDAFRKAGINLVGDLFGLPSAQINRTITGTQALVEGKTDNPMAIGFGFQEQR